MARRLRRHMGVTLIELVITIAIVGLLATIATPSYQNYIRKGERQKAADCLMQVHNRAQVFFQNRGIYPASLAELQLTDPYPCPESKYQVQRDATYDRLTTTDCPAATAKYQFRASAKPAETNQAKDGQLVLGFCSVNDPNRRIVRDRMVGTLKKTWTEN